MTTPTSSESTALEREWAAEQLALAPGEAAARRAALARQLRGHEFLPPADWQALARVTLAVRQSPALTVAEGILTGRRDYLRGEVEAYCAEFFQLDFAPRRRRHGELIAACVGHGPLVARLKSLADGLDVNFVPAGEPPSPEAEMLLQTVGKLFVLRPHDRAVAREAFWEQARSEPRKWITAARTLLELRPEVARLDPPLLSEILGSRKQAHQTARATKARKRAAVQGTENRKQRLNRIACNTVFITLSVLMVFSALVLKSDNRPAGQRHRRRIPAYLPSQTSVTPPVGDRVDLGAPLEFEIDEHGVLQPREATGNRQRKRAPRAKPFPLPEFGNKTIEFRPPGRTR